MGSLTTTLDSSRKRLWGLRDIFSFRPLHSSATPPEGTGNPVLRAPNLLCNRLGPSFDLLHLQLADGETKEVSMYLVPSRHPQKKLASPQS